MKETLNMNHSDQQSTETQGVIICVDDESMILISLRDQLRQLSHMGVSVEMSTDGEDALELLNDLMNEGVEVPLFISDQIMPGLKGNEVLRRVHDISPQTKTVLLTGQADLEAIQAALLLPDNPGGLLRGQHRQDIVEHLRFVLLVRRQGGHANLRLLLGRDLHRRG